MKKLVTFLAVGLALVCAKAVWAADEPLRTTDDVATWQVKDTTDVALGISSGGAVYNTRGLINTPISWVSVPAMGTFTVTSFALQVSTPFFRETTHNGATNYTFLNISSQPFNVPRNLVLYSTVTGAVSITTVTLKGNATFFGIDGLGNPATESISFSTTVPRIGVTPVSGQGNIAWSFISSFTVQITSITDVFGVNFASAGLMMSWGNKLGLGNDVQDPGDVYYVSEGGGLFPNSIGTVDAAYNTYYPNNPPNGTRSYFLLLRAKNSPRK